MCNEFPPYYYTGGGAGDSRIPWGRQSPGRHKTLRAACLRQEAQAVTTRAP